MTYNIALFVPSLTGGGAERVVVNLANQMAINNNVYIIVNKKEGPNLSLISNEVNVHELNSSNIIFSFFKLASFIRKNKFSFVMSTLPGANITLGLSRFVFSDYKWILREANTLTENEFNDSLKQKLIYLLSNFIYSKCDSFIANSPDTKKDLIKYFDIKDENSITVLPNPVISRINYSNYKSKHENKKKLIAIGRLELQKDYHLMLDVITHLKDYRDDFILEIYGVGSLECEIISKINDLGLNPYVHLKGYSKHVDEALNRSDVFLLTSKWEGFGNVIVEALASGTPVLSVLCLGGPSFILKDTMHNSLVDSRSPKILATRLNEMLDKNLSSDDVVFIKKMAEEYKTDIVAKQYLDCFIG